MEQSNNINVGIGFATGRKSFQNILKTHIYNLRESGLTDKENIKLNLLVAYDLKYSKTKSTDYTKVDKKLIGLIDDAYFLGSSEIQTEINYLIGENVINAKEAQLLFSGGYSAQRNIVLYTAIKNNIDYLTFLDDDEYPMSVTKTRYTAIWSGQHVLTTHLENIRNVDITNGHHCGYISPIPHIDFNEKMTETDFRMFIEAISNDIINWDNMQKVIDNGGVTYADTNVLVSNSAQDVQQVNGCKFISGANLCINLTDPTRVYPFYNPPGARGEDTFLSTCLTQRNVLRVPCYTFHDGFSTYKHLMDGVLPITLKPITIESEANIKRFYNACIGWVRYKPLLLYITQQEHYEEIIEEMKEKLDNTLPKICNYFGRKDFMNVSSELKRYHKNVKKHYQDFLDTQRIWSKICEFLASRN
ncbi:MAG: hypothetical protein ACYDG2_24150 [Ruminiclostridium sp.]